MGIPLDDSTGSKLTDAIARNSSNHGVAASSSPPARCGSARADTRKHSLVTERRWEECNYTGTVAYCKSYRQPPPTPPPPPSSELFACGPDASFSTSPFVVP
ncbi:hypothetical protein FQA47_018204, partial [Oryzias melastigma]